MGFYSCAITGHRPTRFKWKYKENNTGCKRLKKRIHDQIVLLYEKGVRRFYVGGALGVDMWAGEIILRLKEEQEYKDIELVIAFPFQGYNEGWDPRSKERLAFLIHHSAECVTVGQTACGESYLQRNRYMVDHADCLLAVYDRNYTIRSGTGQTVRYAESKALPIILIHPDTAVITQDKRIPIIKNI